MLPKSGKDHIPFGQTRPIFGVEIGRWEVVGTFETGISFSEISPVSDSELWIGGVEALPTSEELASRLEELGWDPVGLIGDEGILEKSLIYHFKNGGEVRYTPAICAVRLF